MIFPYRAYEVQPTPSKPSATTIYRPVIPFLVSGPTSNATLFGLVDTGADETILPGFLRAELGLEGETTRTAQFRGVGGQLVTVSFGKVTFGIESGRDSYQWNATVGFLSGPTVAILGQRGFLEHFTAAFSGERREIRLTANRRLARKAA